MGDPEPFGQIQLQPLRIINDWLNIRKLLNLRNISGIKSKISRSHFTKENAVGDLGRIKSLKIEINIL